MGSVKPTLVIDTNIVISILISGQGAVSQTFIEASLTHHFVSCHFLYVELFKHKDKLLKLSKLPEPDFLDYLLRVLNRIEFISETLIPAETQARALKLVAPTDPNDVAFIALSLHLNAPLWTGDRRLQEGLQARGFTNLITTADLRNR